MRLFWIIIATLITTLIVLLSVHYWGLGRVYPIYNYSFFSGTNPIYIARTNSYSEVSSAYLLRPDVVFWLDVRESLDGELILVDPAQSKLILTQTNLGPDKWRGHNLNSYSTSDLQKLIPGTAVLKDFIKKYPKQKMIINVVDNIYDIHKKIVQVLDEPESENRFLIQSDTHVILTSIKSLKPLWIFGTSMADIMRLLSFNSVFILPAAPFQGDVFITPLSILDRKVLNTDVISEMRHRNKRIIIGPISTESEFEEAWALKPDGFFLENPEISKRWIEFR